MIRLRFDAVQCSAFYCLSKVIHSYTPVAADLLNAVTVTYLLCPIGRGIKR